MKKTRRSILIFALLSTMMLSSCNKKEPEIIYDFSNYRDRILYSIRKSGKKETRESLAEKSAVDIDAPFSKENALKLIKAGFQKQLSERFGGVYADNAVVTNKGRDDLEKWLDSYGLIYETESRVTESGGANAVLITDVTEQTLEKEFTLDTVDLYLSRIHYLLGDSLKDDFASYANYSFMMDEKTVQASKKSVQYLRSISQETQNKNVEEFIQSACEDRNDSTLKSFEKVCLTYDCESLDNSLKTLPSMVKTMKSLEYGYGETKFTVAKLDKLLFRDTGRTSFFRFDSLFDRSQLMHMTLDQQTLHSTETMTYIDSNLSGILNEGIENYFTIQNCFNNTELFKDDEKQNFVDNVSAFITNYASFKATDNTPANTNARDLFKSAETNQNVKYNVIQYLNEEMNANFCIDYLPSVFSYFNQCIQDETNFDKLRSYLIFDYLCEHGIIDRKKDFVDLAKKTMNNMEEAIFMAAYQGSESYSKLVKRLQEYIDGSLIAEFKNAFANSRYSSDFKQKCNEKIDKLTKILLLNYENEEIGFLKHFGNLSIEDVDPNDERGLKKLPPDYPKIVDVLNKAATNFTREYVISSQNSTLTSTLAMLASYGFLTINAFYYPENNSFVIIPGIVLASDLSFENTSDENFLSSAGFIIAHEIAHGFGSTLRSESGFLSAGDMEIQNKMFEDINKIVSDYELFPGFRLCGELMQEEDYADMFALKIVEKIASKYSNFNYERFYTNLAEFMYCSFSRENVYNSIRFINHPIGRVRINTLLSSSHKFLDTFSIKEHDFMYPKGGPISSIY